MARMSVFLAAALALTSVATSAHAQIQAKVVDTPTSEKTPVDTAGCAVADKRQSFTIANALLVADDSSKFDDIHNRPKQNLKVGDPFYIYIQPVGYVCPKSDGAYRSKFDVSLQLIYEGKVVVTQDSVMTPDFAYEEPIKVVNMNLTDRISGLIPGDFTIKVIVKDVIADRTAEAMIPLTLDK